MKKLLLILFMLPVLSLQAQQARFDSPPVKFSTGSNFEFVATGDINGDGLNDIAGATTSYFDPNNDYSIFLWLQNSNGVALQPLILHYPHNPGVAGCFAVCDIYKDGSAEILVGVDGTTYIYAWDNGSLKMTDSLYTHTASQDGITCADFDGDGLTDIGISHWNGDRITVIYQNAEHGTKWDIRHYLVPTTARGHVIAGKFGSLSQNALIYVSGGSSPSGGSAPLIVMTFDQTRSMSNKYDLYIPPTSYYDPHSAALRKTTSGNNELWLVYGGNSPNSKTAIWRGLQSSPDTIITIYDIPEAIQAANLDCDNDDEIAIIHGGWQKMTVFTDTKDMYNIFTPSHYKQESLALGDVNNDKRIDVCIANGITPGGLYILYNTTPPCWPSTIPTQKTEAISVIVYPNPSSGTFQISFSNTNYKNAAATVYDVTGRMVLSKQITSASETISMSNAAKGIYTLRIVTENEAVTKRIIIE